MGAWGCGNFENDNASDYMVEVQERLFADVREVLDGAGISDELTSTVDAVIMPIAELLCVIGEHIAPVYLDRSEFEQWRHAVLTAYDRHIDEYNPTIDYKTDRRAVIVQTFARLDKLISADEE
jgi:hypothetical protein